MKRFLLVSLVLAGCVDASSPVSPTPTPAPPSDGSGAPPDAMTGSVYDLHLDANGDAVPIAGANVCIAGHPEVACGSTASDGTYTMEVPDAIMHQPLAVSVTADGYLGEVVIDREGPGGWSWPSGIAMRSAADASDYLGAKASFAYPDADDGFVSVRVNGAGPGLAGVTATISTPGASGPVYAQVGDVPDPSLTSTSPLGVILFGNVTPGPFTVTVAAPGKTCSVDNAIDTWPSATNQLNGLAVAGALSDELYIDCY